LATRNFSTGDFVVEYAGELIDSKESKRREFIYSKGKTKGQFLYSFKWKSSTFW